MSHKPLKKLILFNKVFFITFLGKKDWMLRKQSGLKAVLLGGNAS
tara:strand:+ start:252 stop:386 length:135 start_codon:yes stop_codon:yes gene_type:complete